MPYLMLKHICFNMLINVPLILITVAFLYGGALLLQWQDNSDQIHLWSSIDSFCPRCRCRSEHGGRSVYEFHEIGRKWTCALYVHHRALRPVHFIVWWKGQTRTFKKYDAGYRQAMKCRTRVFLCAHICFSCTYQHFCFVWLKQLVFFTSCPLTITITICTTPWRNWDLRNVHVANVCWP